MSRIGRKPIMIPEGVEIKITDNKLTAKGKKGELFLNLHPLIKAAKKDNHLDITVKNADDKKNRALWGTFRALSANLIKGVNEGFEKKLEFSGVGYRISVAGQKMHLEVGFSHPVEYIIPEGVTAKVEKNIITITGADKALVGQVAAEIRAIKKPEPYKGKGIKYIDEIIKRKAGKVVKTGGEA